MEQKNYSVLIAEDELPAREQLVEYLLNFQSLRLAGIAKNGQEAMEKLSTEKFDLLLLDIHLPVMSGIEVLESLSEIPYVIFTTAYDQYAIKAFDLGAVDYLLKPFSKKRFGKAVEKFLEIKKSESPQAKTTRDFGLSFRERDKHYLLPYQDIIYLSSSAKHSVIHTEERDFETPALLKDLEIKLPKDFFLRVHKQHIVNMNHVSNIEYYLGGRYLCTLRDSDETSLPVGRNFAPILKEKLRL